MSNLQTKYRGSFPVTIPEGKTAIFSFSVQAANRENIIFTKYANEKDRDLGINGTMYKQAGGQGTRLTTFTDAVLESGFYTCQMTTNGRPNVKLLADQWEIAIGGQNRMTTIGVAMEDSTDNDYNDVFMQIYWWNYQN